MMAHSLVLCIGVAAFGGFLISLSYNVISFADHRARKRNTTVGSKTKAFLNFVYLLLSLSGILMFVIASKFGPVAVAMPGNVASNLLWNMILQGVAGITEYSKEMRVGNIILVGAAVSLVDVGPTDPEGGIDVISMVTQPLAAAWILASACCTLMCALLLRFVKASRGFSLQMIVYAVLVAFSNALGATVGKMLTVTSGGLFASCAVLYLLCGVGSLGGGGAAASACDVSIFLPVSQCIQLIVNALTGLCVWGDAARIQAWTAYTMVYFLSILGIYLCSPLNLALLLRPSRTTGASCGMEELIRAVPFNQQLSNVRQDWERLAHESSPGHLGTDLEAALTAGVCEGAVSRDDLVKLCGVLSSALAATFQEQRAVRGKDVSIMLATWGEQTARRTGQSIVVD
eukprot:gnl/TRDRNA2_/TRDRNA2_80434_c0_seq1.p1 gnl/TRDRNA2_/TRDRNA2_80434_c0~~gnl/TRDRNA2_/TRDRNA2_80434_c0_seq1.p1  ORF type:complete len:401 (-),score=57.31 gnl/TRDRNA2_/TRDRNA2_80434_c0_seq1:45-1247(-)